MKQKRRISIPAFGGSSLLVIFAVLCLTLFALLGLSTAQASARMNTAAAEAVTAYYAADLEAERILALLRQGSLPENVQKNGDTYSWSCPVNERQRLEIEVRLEGSEYEVLRWQLVSSSQWLADDSLNVWQGGELG